MMDTRIRLKEIRRFIGNFKKDYRSGNGPSRDQKKSALLWTLRLLFMYVWDGISAPLVYPLWYAFRKSITEGVYKGTSWQEVVDLVDHNKTGEVKRKLKANGKFLYWLWTYGDLRDPLGLGELTGTGKRNTFWNRYWENGFRNCRFTVNFMEFRTSEIVSAHTAIDGRDFAFMHKSEGIGDSPDGIYFKWVVDEDGRCGFIYEDNNEENIFYYGFVGLLKKDVGNNGRFEVAYRKTGSSYRKQA